MRKLLLSASVVAGSLAYVAWVALTHEGGMQALFERVTFQPAKRALPHLDLDDPLLRVEAAPATAVSPVEVATSADVGIATGAALTVIARMRSRDAAPRHAD